MYLQYAHLIEKQQVAIELVLNCIANRNATDTAYYELTYAVEENGNHPV